MQHNGSQEGFKQSACQGSGKKRCLQRAMLGARSLSAAAAAAAAHRPSRASSRCCPARRQKLRIWRGGARFSASQLHTTTACSRSHIQGLAGLLGPAHFILIQPFVAAIFCVPSRLVHLTLRASLPFLPSSRSPLAIPNLQPGYSVARRTRRASPRRICLPALATSQPPAAFHDCPFVHNSSSCTGFSYSSDTILHMASYASKRCRC